MGSSNAKFQYLSDLHLDTYTFPHQAWQYIKPVAPYLIIAGDVGNIDSQWYLRFLTEVSQMFKYVFLTTGNHEYHYVKGCYISNTKKWMSKIDHDIRMLVSPLKNVIYLQNEYFLIPETRIAIYGMTLWSRILDEEWDTVRNVFSDYRNIPQFTSTTSIELYEHSLQHLSLVLESNPQYNFVVFSHHLPSYQLLPLEYQFCKYKSAFASQVELAKNPRILAWVAGHTHKPIQVGKFFVNPIGNFDENEKPNFNLTFTVDGGAPLPHSPLGGTERSSPKRVPN